MPVPENSSSLTSHTCNLGPGVIGRGSIVPQSQIANAVTQPFANSNHAESSSKLSEQPMKNFLPRSSLGLRQPQVARPFSGVRTSSLDREPNHQSDFQGLVLTLGGSGSGSGGP